MRELSNGVEDLREPDASSGAEQKKFGVVALETVKHTFFVYARDEVEAAERCLNEDIDDSIPETQRVSMGVLEVAEVGA